MRFSKVGILWHVAGRRPVVTNLGASCCAGRHRRGLCLSFILYARELRGMDIRDATEADAPDIQAIYAHHVLTGTGTFEEEPPAVEEMDARFRNVVSLGCVWLVATDATGVLGFGYYTPFRARSAYRFTVEDSIYVREDVRGQGVGKALVSRLIVLATLAGLRQMIAVIGDSENVGSMGGDARTWVPLVGRVTTGGE